ncbi:MAG: caspase family protein [Crocinitomicaceae bacterium]
MKNYIFLFFLITSNILSFSQEAELITQERNLGVITKIVYNSDGEYIANINDGENTIKVWEVQSGKIIGVLEGHEKKITSICFTDKDSKIVSGDLDGKIIIWDLNSWDIADSSRISGGVLTLQSFSDGNRIYAGSVSGEIYEIQKNKSWQAESIINIKAPITQLTLNETETKLLVGTRKGIVALIDTKSNSKIKVGKILASAITGIALIENDSKIIVSGGSGIVQIWDATTFKKLNQFQAHLAAVTSMDYNPKKKMFVTGSQDRSIKLWDMQTQKAIHTYVNENEGNGADEPVRCIVFSPDGNTFASTGFKNTLFKRTVSKDNVIKVWDVNRKILYKNLKGEVNPVLAFCFNDNLNQLVTMNNERMLTFWDFNKGEPTYYFQLPEPKDEKDPNVGNEWKDEAENVGTNFLNGGRISLGGLKNVGKNQVKNAIKSKLRQRDILRITTKGNYLLTKIKNDELRLYDISGDDPVYKHPIFHGQMSLNDFAVTNDEKLIACAGGGATGVSVVDLESGKLLKKLDTKPSVGELELILEIKSVQFSHDGSLLLVCFNTGQVNVYSTNSWNVVFSNADKSILNLFKKSYANFSRDGKTLIVNGYDGLKTYTVGNYSVSEGKTLSSPGNPVRLNRPSDVIVTATRRNLHYENIFTGVKSQSPEFNTLITSSISIDKNGFIGISKRNGEFQIVDPATGKALLTLVGEDENYIFKTQDNYYKVSKDGFDLVTFRIGRFAYPFEQFDLKFNRPDIVLTAMHSENPDLIKVYESAYLKRLKKMGLDESHFSKELHLPTIELLNKADLPLVSETDQVSLKVKGNDSKYKLDRLQVWINDVPLYGNKGISLESVSEIEKEIPLELVQGMNKIQVSVLNEKGAESLKKTIDVDFQGKKEKHLYLVTIGTSIYKDKRFNLNYAAKDAKDLVSLYSENKNFDQVHTLTLTDAEVINANLERVREFLKEAKINDEVILFIAGHGVLDDEFNYYYGTHDIDFLNPSRKGLEYSKLEALLDGIKPIKKLLIMDTCHSGEIDKEEVMHMDQNVDTDDEIGDVAFRAVGIDIQNKDKGVSTSKVMNTLFNDLRRGSGATVISSAGGVEYAMESEEWKNGLFTYVLLMGIKSQKADLNNDGKIQLSELQFYVIDRVSKLSKGKQVPNTRMANISNDYVIW